MHTWSAQSIASLFRTSLRDPSTYIPRPTSAKTPDVSHILASLFGEAYTKEILSADVIKNLSVASDVDNDYHKQYVERLKQVNQA